MRDRTELMLKLRRFLPVLLTGTLLTAVSFMLYIAQPRVLTQVSLNVYDLFLARRTATATISPVPVIVDLDEASLRQHGQWPWPRHRLAMLLQKLSNSGAAVVALDMLLSEPDRTSPETVVRALREELNVDAQLTGLPEQLYDNDAFLAATVRLHPIVLGGFIRFDEQTDRISTNSSSNPASDSSSNPSSAPARGVATTAIPGVPNVERIQPGGIPAISHLIRGQGLVPLVPVLENSGPVAFFNMMPDQDGLVRRVPLVAMAGDTLYASLSLRSLMRAMNVKNLRLNSGPNGLQSLNIGKLNIPVSPEGLMLVPYPGPAHSFPYISAADVLSDTFDPERVRGRVVFLGTSAVGLLDIRSTPLDRYTPGVEVHATVVNAALTGEHIVSPPWETALQAGGILLSGILGLLLFALLPPVGAMIGCLALAGGAFAGSAHLFSQGLFFTPVWSMFTLLTQGTSLMLQQLWTTERDKRRLRSVFSRYVSPEVVRRIVERGETVLQGEERQLTIMFTDLRGFTSLSEGLTPPQVVSLLNRYFTPMTGLIRASEGTVDKFIGDAIMAFWNAPLDVSRHPERAVTTALNMLRDLDTLNATLQPELGVTLRMGAGIHTGTAYVGNMGSEELTSYTCIGDAVNLASRLEGLCSRFGVTLVLSDDTATDCQHCQASPTTDGVQTGEQHECLTFIPLARLRVKGRSAPLTVFTALFPEDAATRAKELETFRSAREQYIEAVNARDAGRLTAAAEAFAALSAAYPALFLYAEYERACRSLLKEPLDVWTDIWTFTSK